MSVSFTYPKNTWTGKVVAEGYAPDGNTTVNLPAGAYMIESIPTFFYFKSPANFTPKNKASEYFSASTITLIFLPKDDSNFELQSRIPYDSTAGSGLTNGFYPQPVWDGTNFCATIGGMTQGRSGLIAYSTDFLKWEYKDTGANNPPATTASGANNLAYNANVTNKYVFCAATNSTTTAVWTSTDFTTWTSRSLPAAPASTGPMGVTINSNATNKYILNLGGTASNQFCYSTDAVTWTQATFTYAAQIQGLGATNNTASTNQVYVYPGANSTNNLLTSTDGVTWTSRSSGHTIGAIEVVWFNNNYYVFYSSNNYAYSTDGVTWTTATLPTEIQGSDATLKSTIFSNKLYKRTSVSGLFVVTTNGTTWTLERYSSQNICLMTDTTKLFYHTTSGSSLFSGSLPIPLWYRIYAVNDSSALA